MNTKSTWIWFVVAATLAAFIFIFQHYLRPPENVAGPIFPGLQPSQVTSIQIIPSVPLEIRADRVNGSWLLSKPFSYPAQSAAIEALLAALQKLAPTKISPAELRGHTNPDAEFGFDNPQTTLVISAGTNRWQLKVGKMTAPGDQVYLRAVGTDGVFVSGADWLKFIPRSAADWRSTALVEAGQNGFDSIILTNGAKVIELHRDATNRLWRMTRPLQSRANNDLINGALQQLQAAQVTQFVTDNTNADLTSFGLQPADLDLWLGHGTNFTLGIHVGKSPTNNTTQVYAKREAWNAIVTIPSEPFVPWHGAVNDFRDPFLLELTAPVSEIEVRDDGTNNYTLQRQGTNGWRIAGEKFPTDAANVQQFLKTLAGLRVADFVAEAVTGPDLQAYGLATNSTRQITLRSTIGDSNAVIAQLSFAVRTNGIFVHRTGEDFIYSITPEDYNRLPDAGWEFRDRQIWYFSASNVVQITLHQGGRTRTMLHTGVDKWSLTAGSGIITGKYIEDTTTALGNLSAFAWVGRDVTPTEENGFNTNKLQITFEMKNGEKHSVDFGTELPKWPTALASVTL
ncbi:MAG TPA: DUF4340 domain-containing protein, partial [Candidatus Paceibacterota bacterium]|nr:DUF4340 domain-containing protein [Candidatus Paceibacterota bacterium]